MRNEDWLNSFVADKTLRELVPMELIPGMPLPWMCGEKLLIYVPFYCIQPGQEQVFFSKKLLEINFAAVTKQIVSFRDLRFREPGLTEKDMLRAALPDNASLEEQELLRQDLLHKLDKIEEAYRRKQIVPEEALEEYRQALTGQLMFPAQAAMYDSITL